MDRSLIERLAREASPGWLIDSDEYEAWPDDLHRFAALVAEECAKVCDTLKDSRDFPEGWGPVSEACAAAIRAKFALDSRQPSPSPTTD